MVKASIPGVNTATKLLANGQIKTYYYHRATGHRLPGKRGSSEFIRAYAAADELMANLHRGMLFGLIRDYTLSPEFEKLAASTQKEYRRMLTKAEAQFGTLPIAALEDQRVRKIFMDWRAEVARQSGYREADNRLSVISAMLSWARENGQIFSNHVSGFRRLYSVDRSEMIWLPEHINAFMQDAPIEMQRALILALHSGQRQGDLRRMTWSDYADGMLTFRQGKGKRRMEIPCTATLRTMLDTMPRDNAIILTTKTGIPWKERYFKAQWDKASKAAGIVDLHFHDLRGTAITMLSEAGCTAPQIAAITGHSMKHVTSILDKYLARTRVLSGEAIALFENARSTRFANQLQTSAQKTTKGKSK